ncbi:4-oxalocrotonate tautomerase [Flavivirga aquatica]|uniref:4-oxalocrotonate tautomerase n=1 Tax=Flavivirga aquatica TaxID=1849968 RepID=A0A1E5TA76_9FLAO|nr:4-oxalocrotonate tautomerase DmpI [Flavivirga aquatica]OEK08279.1 4-oxalocrotonate tautomerase [Flavivirga aquatica]
MPYILFETSKLEKEVKQKLIEKLTETSADITGIPKEFFFISINELPDDDIAIGGKTVTEMKKEKK